MSNATHFSEGTPGAVKIALEHARTHGTMVRLMLGDPKTGVVWHEENDIAGFIGRSAGTQKILLLVEALIDDRGFGGKRIIGADGGPEISTANILRIIDCETGRDLYRHPKYRVPEIKIVPYALPEWAKTDAQKKQCANLKYMVEDGGAAFHTYEEAQTYVALIQGVKTHMPLRTVSEWRKEVEAE